MCSLSLYILKKALSLYRAPNWKSSDQCRRKKQGRAFGVRFVLKDTFPVRNVIDIWSTSIRETKSCQINGSSNRLSKTRISRIALSVQEASIPNKLCATIFSHTFSMAKWEIPNFLRCDVIIKLVNITNRKFLPKLEVKRCSRYHNCRKTGAERSRDWRMKHLELSKALHQEYSKTYREKIKNTASQDRLLELRHRNRERQRKFRAKRKEQKIKKERYN